MVLDERAARWFEAWLNSQVQRVVVRGTVLLEAGS